MALIHFSLSGRPLAATRAQALAQADAARLRRYRDYLAFYEGQHYGFSRAQAERLAFWRWLAARRGERPWR